MDLRLGVAAPATDEERAAFVPALGAPESGWDGDSARRPTNTPSVTMQAMLKLRIIGTCAPVSNI